MDANKMSAVRWYSITNPFIDCIVYVPSEYRDKAVCAMSKARDTFWDDEDLCYGDCVLEAMRNADIPFTALFLPWNDDMDCPLIEDDVWEKLINTCEDCIRI